MKFSLVTLLMQMENWRYSVILIGFADAPVTELDMANAKLKSCEGKLEPRIKL